MCDSDGFRHGTHGLHKTKRYFRNLQRSSSLLWFIWLLVITASRCFFKNFAILKFLRLVGSQDPLVFSTILSFLVSSF